MNIVNDFVKKFDLKDFVVVADSGLMNKDNIAELERILKISGIKLSVDKVLSIAKTITTIKVKLQDSKEVVTKTMLLTDKHKSIARLFEAGFWENFR